MSKWAGLGGPKDTAMQIAEALAEVPAPMSATSLDPYGQLVKMLMRTPGANDNTVIYNDLARLEETLTTAASDYMARKAAEDSKPVPKTKKYYKELKEKQAKEQGS